MSRSFRSPRTRTRIHKVKRQLAIDKMHEKEIREELGASCTSGSEPQTAMMGADSTQELANAVLSERCPNCVFVTTGTRCPECGEISAPNYSLESVRTTERLYGTVYGSGKWNDGLGERTYGKSDFRRKMEASGLRVREPGDARDAADARRDRSRKQRAVIEKAVGETTRHFEL